MTAARVLPLPVFVAARDVQMQLGCSRSESYRLLRLAAGRGEGDTGMLRVPLAAWQRFVEEKFKCACSDDAKAAGPSGPGSHVQRPADVKPLWPRPNHKLRRSRAADMQRRDETVASKRDKGGR